MSTLDDLSRTTPHLRGEEASSPAGTKSRRELPPPARGRAALREPNVSPGGTTPTCAGKSYDPEYHARRRRNYPHLRGEECSSPPSSASAIELPPPARGRGGGRWRVVHPAGTTPTCAGKRRNTRNFIAKIWNYPHLRGEEACLLARQARQMELPPPARGRADLEGNYGTISGTTPTCAGKRRSRAPENPSKRNYPHLRGEEASRRSAFQWSLELPPPARGRVRLQHRWRARHGTTPTCAGKRAAPFAARHEYGNYPHLRGEEGGVPPLRRYFVELPPPARGRDCLTWSFIRGGPEKQAGTEFQLCGSPRDASTLPARQAWLSCQFPRLKFSLFCPVRPYRTRGVASDYQVGPWRQGAYIT